jgi:ABC-2 type transport system permease protein
VLLRTWNLVQKELIQFRRDWLMTTFILTLPVLQLILLAQATSSRISNLCVAALDHDRSSASRRLVTALDNRRELAVRHFPATLADTHRLITDASDNIPASIATSAARRAVAAFARETRFFPENPVSTVDLRTTVRFNPTFNHKFFTVPAQVGFIVYQVTLTVASIGLARERELGTLEQLVVMPLRRVELVIGKAIPALVVGMLNFLLMLTVAICVFHVPMRGSLLLLVALTLLFIVAEIGYGIFISGIARTQQQAILFVFVLAMVDMTFSGYVVRVKRLPTALRTIAQVVPFRHYLTIIRGVMLKGTGLDALWPHAAAMLLIGLLVTAVAVRNLSRSLD